MNVIKEKTFLVADTETTGVAKRAIVFDFAYTIATRKAVKLERSFLVRETITNPRIMLRAIGDNLWRESFGGKLFTHYIPELHRGNIALYSWREIVETLRDDMQTHGVDVFCAYNLKFDMGALATTQALLRDSGKILAYGPDLLCLWQFACDTVCQTPLYHRAAHEFGWISEAQNVRTNAEKVYAFLTGEFDFIESHTALADAQIETEILQRLLAKKKRIPYNELDHMPWRKAQRIGLAQRRLFS